jgi:hypothetical protein
MTLASRTGYEVQNRHTIGRYEIIALRGAVAMGEGYRALAIRSNRESR